MRVLGAILAGGKSSRFGSDKCDLVIGGKRLIDHAIDALAYQVDVLVICGRWEEGLLSLDDQPHPGLGPLGGLNAALRHANANGFEAVLSTPADVVPLPSDLLSRLHCPGPTHLFNQHAVGCWPASLADALSEHLAQGNRSVKSWNAVSRSMAVDDGDLGLYNLNEPKSLDAVSRRLQESVKSI